MLKPQDAVRRLGETFVYVQRLDEVERREMEWLWKPFLPRGKVCILRGDPGQGKTTFALKIAAAISTGTPLPGMDGGPVIPGHVLILSAEDDVNDALAPRLDAAGADSKNVFFASDTMLGAPLTFTNPDFIELPRGISPYPSLIIIDPVQAFLGSSVDSHRANEVRPAMANLIKVAYDCDSTILLIEHLNKNAGGKAIHRGLGSMDFAAAVRSIMMLGTNPDNFDEKGVALVKSSYGKEGAVLGFNIDEMGLHWDEDSSITYRMITGETGGSSSKVGKSEGISPSALDEAKYFIKEVLKEGKRTSRDMYILAKGSGIKERTLQRAAKELDIDFSEVAGIGKDRVVYWKLPVKPVPPQQMEVS